MKQHNVTRANLIVKIAGRYFNPSCLKIFQKLLRALFHSPVQFTEDFQSLKQQQNSLVYWVLFCIIVTLTLTQTQTMAFTRFQLYILKKYQQRSFSENKTAPINSKILPIKTSLATNS